MLFFFFLECFSLQPSGWFGLFLSQYLFCHLLLPQQIWSSSVLCGATESWVSLHNLPMFHWVGIIQIKRLFYYWNFSLPVSLEKLLLLYLKMTSPLNKMDEFGEFWEFGKVQKFLEKIQMGRYRFAWLLALFLWNSFTFFPRWKYFLSAKCTWSEK